MKSVGIVRNVDELGRFVIPRELRKIFNISPGDPMEVFTDDEMIILKKYVSSSACILCGEITDTEFKGKSICPGCIKELKALD